MFFILKILCVCIGATAIMTAFSYMASFLGNKNFREPELINLILDNLKFFPFNIKKKSVLGWVLHFLIGFIFTLLGFSILALTELVPDATFGISFGAIAGVFAMIVWSIGFKITKRILSYSRSIFNFQIFIAHVLFGLSMASFFSIFYLN